MILIIGGAFQGKAEYAKTLLEGKSLIDGADCAMEEIFSCSGIDHFQLYIRRCLQEGCDVTGLAERLIRENPGIVIVSTELGYGVVPIDAFDRAYREATGRVCTKLAAAATHVYRVICGIPTTLK